MATFWTITVTLITVPTKGVEEQTCSVKMMQCIYAEVV
jgi:hypothetical protein